MPDGCLVGIEHVADGKSNDTLEVRTFPSGGNIGALEAMKDKAQGWVNKVKKRKPINNITLVSTRKTVIAKGESWIVRQYSRIYTAGRLS